jgi:hypothetical protein
MTEIMLLEKRNEVKRFLSRGSDRTLIGVVLDRTSHAVKKVTRSTHAIPVWYSAAIISLLILLVGSLTSIILGEFSAVLQTIVPIEILGAVLTTASLVIYKVFIDRVFANLRDNIIDAIISQDSLADLRRWLDLLCNTRWNFVFSLVYGLTTGILSARSLSVVKQANIGYGPFVTFCLVAFTWGMSMYFLLVFLILPIRLARYKYRMYNADPSSSGVIHHLSNLLEGMVYLYAVVAGGTMVYLAWAGLLSSTAKFSIEIMSILVAWLPITVLFVAGQYALAVIISGAKRQRLDEIQSQIEQIQATEDITQKDTMEKINRLMDYHDRIKSTKDSRLDFRATLSFLNSLLFPVIGFVLGNLETLRNIFNKLGQP